MISSSFANGVSGVFDYDVNGRMTHMERFKNGAPPTMLVEYDYGYDTVGNRLYNRELMATNRSELYGYDARNRLRNFERGTLNTAGDDITTPLVDPVLPSQQQWTDLDRRGNWLDFSTTLNGQPAVQQTREANQVNEITTLDPDGPGGGQSAVTLANDSNGNLTENPWAFNADDGGTPTGQKYEYDEENQLVRVRRLSNNEILLEIGYDAVGRRVESKEYLDAQTQQMLTTARVTHHVVLGPMTIEEYSITAGPTALLAREFVWGTEFPMPVAIVDWTTAGQVGAGQSEVLHYLRDVLGNVVALTDANGDVVERYRYDPYGMTRIYNAGGTLLPTSAYGNPFAFTGQRHDAAVALYHFAFRTYCPSLGRWHQRDPVGYTDGVSLFEYSQSGPLNWSDPFGLLSTPGCGPTSCPAPPDPVSRSTLVVETRSGDWIHRWFWGHFFGDGELTNMTDRQMVAVAGGGAVAIVAGGYVGWYLPEIIAAAGPAGASGVDKISGYTKHGINSAISHNGVGVSPSAILNAVRNPQEIIVQSGGKLKYVGEQATVVLNENGQVITTWATSSQGVRNCGGN